MKIDSEIIKKGMITFGLTKAEITRQIQDLIDRELIIDDGDGSYTITQEGEEFLKTKILRDNRG